MHIPPPLIMAAGLVVLLAADFYLPGLSIAAPGQGIIAAAFVIAGFAIAGVALASFLRAKTTFNPVDLEKSSALVTGGLYAFTRNPMYLGLALVLTGAGIGMGTLVTPFVVAALVLILNEVQIAPEEEALEKRFGEDYRAYKDRVRRWI